MPEIIQEFTTRVRDEDGTVYVARAVGEEREDGTWVGWIEFHPATGDGPVLRTGQETSQPNRVTVEYWASGLEPLYFEGALRRARDRVQVPGAR
jgi:hypothetical protein